MIHNVKILGLILLLFVGTQTTTSQEVAMNSSRNLQAHQFNNPEEGEKEKEFKIESAILKEGEYTFDNGKKNVLVVIKDGHYTEHYSEGEFIKAQMKWVSKDEYNLIITDINKENLPFGVGTKLHTKIFRVKGSRYYYESNLEGLSWTGRFTKIKK
ncbi:hypothetical protein [uncultured Polaribacter sp.]|uniref:hypothetical protein n=1 Tax=uncultured Polaribacter sp. TaxID=174711 RepID=UPI00262A5EC8|nr:hypothetical protein [uncultured Polaribacter sp.]